MEVLIGILLIFLITTQVQTFMWVQWFDAGWSGAPLFFQEQASAPLLILTFGLPIYLMTQWSVRAHLADRPATECLFPPLFGMDVTPQTRAIGWERISAVLSMVPLLFFGWASAWVLRKGDTWLREGTDLMTWTPIPLWQAHPACGPLDFSSCRHGEIGQTAVGRGNGVDVLPFWQPLMVTLMATLALLIAALILREVVRRDPIRRRAVR
jgi:hypothetical protein